MLLLRRHRMTLASITVLIVGAAALLAFALTTKGYPVRHVDLNDGGIWVTSSRDQLFGRLNKPAGSLDAAVNPLATGAPASAPVLDVRQSGAAVVGWDEGAGKLYPIDVSKAAISRDHATPMAGGAQVALGGHILAVLNPDTGKIWAQTIDPTVGVADLAKVDPSARPVATVDLAGSGGPRARAAMAVGLDGTILAVSTSGRELVVTQRGTEFAPPTVTKIDTHLSSVQVTSVGTRPIVFDAEAGNLVIGANRVVRIPGSTGDASLQAPSGDGSSVVIATTTALVSVDLGSGRVKRLFEKASGVPAQPTWLGDCVYAAWAGSPGLFERSCGGGNATAGNVRNIQELAQPVFRVNRDSIVLNDLQTGAVFDVESGHRVDNWKDVKPPPIADRNSQTQNDNPTANQQDLPPKAVDDHLGARPGRTTVLHVLDNDSDPQGYILSISSISDVTGTSTPVTISPDGQTVEVSLPDGSSGAHFKYTVDNGKGLSATASVEVQPRSATQNTIPNLREGFSPQAWSVAAGGTLSLPVIGDWRDGDGDPVVLTKAATARGTVTTTSDGRVSFTAPATPGPTTVDYQVSDGFSGAESAKSTLSINVLDPASTATVPAVAEPDIVRGAVGQPMTIHPLDNDLPGADPANPAAHLSIAAQVASPEGTKVDTDPRTGIVTVVANRVGTFALSYSAAFGNAPFSKPQTIRVDATPKPTSDQTPVAMPDSAVIHGQAPTLVDVLTNDFDPAGGVLVVQHAEPAAANGQLQIAVVQGHWLRINALVPTLAPSPQLVRYSITNGITTSTSGEVTVTQLPAETIDTPVPQDDYASVRAGDSVSVPVLDNDTNPGGDPISLVSVVAGAPKVGELAVHAASTSTTDVGSAFVAGPLVRYVAPDTVPSLRSVTVEYVAQDSAGDQAVGHLHITINPAPGPSNPNKPPSPQPIESRLVAGDTVRIPIPAYGVDPEGDSVTVTGIGAAPSLGRVVGQTATSITYEAFPTSAGTDSFTYRVTDQFDAVGEATIRIGVVPPGTSQPPVAVDDEVVASPGSRVQADVLGNDIYSVDDNVRIVPAGGSNARFPSGVTLVSPSGPLSVKAPPDNGKPFVLVYGVTNGVGAPSIAKLTVRGRADFNNPPRAFDVFAEPVPNATTVAVRPLARDSDPEGGPLQLLPVRGATATKDGVVTLPVTGHAHAVPYQIADAKGAIASAVIHVPAVGAGAPFVKAGQPIKVDRNGSKTVILSDYVADPTGRPVRLTTTDKISASPSSGLKVSNVGDSQLKVTGQAGYVGPAAINFEVTDASSLDGQGQRALLSIPVQVGPETPVLRCPSEPLVVIEGGASLSVDVASVCHVWVANRSTLPNLRFSGTWVKRAAGVTAGGSGSHQFSISAAGAAKPGDVGQLSVTVPGSAATSSTLSFQVAAARAPTVTPIVIDGFKVGSTATFDLANYVRSELRDPQIVVIDINQIGGGHATVGKSGSSVMITPGPKTSGILSFNVVVSDVADIARKDRQATGSIRMNVLNVPDAPTNVVPDRSVLSHIVQLSWGTPANNGAPIDYYQVEASGVAQQCPASPCSITGLVNGHDYSFTVKAHNLVGLGAPSAPSPNARPDEVPDAVTQISVSDPQDGRLTLTWPPAHTGGTPVKEYRVTWGNGGSATVSGTTATPSGLINDSIYTFSVTAVNDLGPGSSQSVQGQSAGRPPTPGAPTFTATNDTSGNRRVVVLNWSAVDPNGISPTTYRVTRSAGSTTTTLNCADKTATTCQDPNIALDGTKYAYSITAMNAAAAQDPANHTSAAGPITTMEATATPDGITNLATHMASATPDGQVPVTFDVGLSHGASSTVNCSYSGGSCGSGSFPVTGQTGAALTLAFPSGWSGSFTLTDCNGSTQSDTQAGSRCNSGTSASVATNGPPNPPVNPVCLSDNGSTATFQWSQPSPVGSRTSGFSYNLGGAASGNTTATQVTIGVAFDGQQRTVYVYTVDSQGEQSGGNLAVTCQDPSPPAATIVASQGATGWSPIGTCPSSTSGCNWLNFTLSPNFSSGTYTWQCISNGSISYNSADYGITRSFVAGGSYGGSGTSGYCLFGPGVTEQIRINGITSNGVTHNP